MQNKANLLDAQMNVSYVKTMNYEQITMNNANKNKPKTNPTCSELACGACPACPEPVEGSLPKGARSNRRTYFRKAKMKLNFYSTKDYENEPRLRRSLYIPT